ncbi:MAG: HD domain-containing protein [Planctomycetes bacterium]|nr:HD domain-containing protein [Planctomycetota bacterium]
MKRRTTDMLVTTEELGGPLYHQSGATLFAKGEPLRHEHIDLMREHRIDHVFEPEENESLTAFLQTARFERLHPKDLLSTHKLAQPIYSGDGRLLVQQDQSPTPAIKQILIQQKIAEVLVYKNEVREDVAFEFVRGKREIQKKSTRRMLAKMALQQAKMMLAPETISEKTVDDLTKNTAEMNVMPEGEALDRLVRSNQKARSAEDKSEFLAKFRESCTITKSLYESIANGELIDGTKAMDVAKSAVYMMVDDKDLFCNLLNVSVAKVDPLIEHAVKTSFLATNIASAMRYGDDQVFEVSVCALLADVGMKLVPESIREKQGELSAQERAKINAHPAYGLQLLKKLQNFPKTALFTVYQHHERCNATGYPKQAEHDRIHRYARLVALADVYTALTSERPYRGAIHPYNALEMLIKASAGKQFDSELVKGQLRYLSLFPVGSYVELSNGYIARVVCADKTNYSKPVVQPLLDARTMRRVPDIRAIELSKSPDVKVTRAVDHRQIDAEVSFGF